MRIDGYDFCLAMSPRKQREHIALVSFWFGIADMIKYAADQASFTSA